MTDYMASSLQNRGQDYLRKLSSRQKKSEKGKTKHILILVNLLNLAPERKKKGKRKLDVKY